MSASDCVVMKEFFECFATGDIPGCMARMHDDCVLVEGEGLPHSGTFVGGEGFLQLGFEFSDFLVVGFGRRRAVAARDASHRGRPTAPRLFRHRGPFPEQC